MTAPSIQPGQAAPEGGGFVLDFGRGSREQTQGGPARNRNNVHSICKPADTVAVRD